MRAAFDDHAIFHHENQIGFANRRQAMRDDEARASTQNLAKSGLNEAFALGVKIASRFIKNENAWIRKHRARERKSLSLAA
jgi:hypothetical protein